MLDDIELLVQDAARDLIENRCSSIAQEWIFAVDSAGNIHAIPTVPTGIRSRLLRWYDAVGYIQAWEDGTSVVVASVIRACVPRFKRAALLMKGHDRVLGAFVPAVGIDADLVLKW